MHSPVPLVGLLLGLALLVDKAGAQGANKYYTGPGNYTGYCPIGTCSVANSGCATYQYVSGCTFNTSGVCTDYTGITPGKYFSGSSGLGLSNSEGVQTMCTPCGAGSSNPGCSASSAGSCVTCSAGLLPANNYWTVPPNATVVCPYAAQAVAAPGFKITGQNSTFAGVSVSCSAVSTLLYFATPILPTENCVTAAKTICAAGNKNVGSSTISAGACQACSNQVPGTYWIANTAYTDNCPSAICLDSCGVGQYRKFCTGIVSGTCSPCTTANASQAYVTSGNWTDSCKVDGCVKTCPTGQYISNCGANGITQATLTCSNCNNNVANVNFYWTQGSYLIGSCTVAACKICDNGNYLVGCGSVASSGLSVGTCTTCTNTAF